MEQILEDIELVLQPDAIPDANHVVHVLTLYNSQKHIKLEWRLNNI